MCIAHAGLILKASRMERGIGRRVAIGPGAVSLPYDRRRRASRRPPGP